MMGSSAAETTREGLDQKLAERERPPHAVRITRAFALGQFAVTRGEFAAFSQDTGHDPSGCYIFANGNFVLDQNRSWRNPGFEQTDRHPVVCVSHEDAQRYVQWLSRRTGKSYRLPAEAEWEYSARAGTTTARFWGDGRDQACNFANVADLTGAAVLNWDKSDKDRVFQCRDGYAYTAPVGSFRPNAFGLYDMLGNVWQGTEDCYHDSYSGAPNDASAWVGGECKNRVLRGGSWALAPRELRAAERIRGGSGDRDFYSGFRVGRALSP
jgi:formylglycine-generating enzyme required for sulfatase activity